MTPREASAALLSDTERLAGLGREPRRLSTVSTSLLARRAGRRVRDTILQKKIGARTWSDALALRCVSAVEAVRRHDVPEEVRGFLVYAIGDAKHPGLSVVALDALGEARSRPLISSLGERRAALEAALDEADVALLARINAQRPALRRSLLGRVEQIRWCVEAGDERTPVDLMRNIRLILRKFGRT